MNGFCAQNTTFPFICIIVDDASTDGEPEIIKQYLDENFDSVIYPFKEETSDYCFTFARHKENENCYFAVFFLKSNHYQIKKTKSAYYRSCDSNSRYIAICEGDDYWTNPDKLQIQFDFLESHSDYSMCFHNAIEHWEDGSKEDSLFSHIENRDYIGSEFFRDWIIPTASVVFRAEVIYKQYYKNLISSIANISSYNKTHLPGDIIVFISCANEGKVRGMDFIASVYRRHTNSATFVMSYWGYIQNYYYFQKVLESPYNEISIDLFFEGAPHMFVAFLKNKVMRRSILKKSFDISVTRTFKEYIKYFYKVLIDKLSHFRNDS